MRSRAASTLALVLALLGLTALGTVTGFPRLLPLAPRELRVDPSSLMRMLLAASVIYAAASLTCAYGLWRMRAWAPLAYLAVAAGMIVYVLLLLYSVRPSMAWVLIAVCGLTLLAAVYGGWRIVARSFAPPTDAL